MRCSFCGKKQDEVHTIIAGPGVYICNECIEVCNNIILNRRIKKETTFNLREIPSPREIKNYLDEYVIG